MTILADDEALYGLWFNDQKHFGGRYEFKLMVPAKWLTKPLTGLITISMAKSQV